jgi:AcrR family transcriptional regulator
MRAPTQPGLTRRDRYALQTRHDLLQAAAVCFGTQGYQATSLSDIGREAKMTRGAIYHHFENKQALFEEVLLDQLATCVAELRSATTGDDPVERAGTALTTFLQLCTAEPFRAIVMEQGPIALGWQRWRELDQAHTLQVIKEHLQALAEAGVIAVEVTAVLTQLLYACLHEAADLVAHTPPEQRGEIQQEAVAVVLRFLAGLGGSG